MLINDICHGKGLGNSSMNAPICSQGQLMLGPPLEHIQAHPATDGNLYHM